MACFAMTPAFVHTPQLVSLRTFQPGPINFYRGPIRGSKSALRSPYAEPDVPWTLMGRTVHLGADRETSDQPEEVVSQPDGEAELLEEFRALLPHIADRLINGNRSLAIKLSRNTPAVAARLVALKVLFPNSNVLDMVDKRPSLLLEEEFCKVEGNLRQLQQAMPGADVQRLAEQQPLFLSEDVEVILTELRSLHPEKQLAETAKLLAQDPKLASLLVLRLNVRSQVRDGVPRMRYP